MLVGASIYDHDIPPGFRVLVMRYWPRGVRRERVDVWVKDAAPSAELIRALRHEGLGWDEFARRYVHEVTEERPQALDQVRALEKEHGTLVLLCTERIPPEEHCHRLLLIDLLT